MKLWIARDKDSNELYLYNHKPLLNENEEQYQPNLDKNDWVCLEVISSWFPEVTFENSPMQIELKLV